MYDQIINNFNKTESNFPDLVTIQELLEAQVKKHSSDVAVICESDKSFLNKKYISYYELNTKANQLAHYIRELGVKPDDVIGLVADRSFAMIIGIWGIIKSGGAYLPIAPDSPVERINFMLSDSKAKILLVQYKNQIIFNFEGTIIELEAPEIYQGPFENPPLINTSRNLVYVIYTSGSTGKPKGVMIEHRSLINRLTWMQKQYPISNDDVILQKTPFYFDVSVWELFWWAVEGAKMCFLLPGGEKIPFTIVDAIEEHKISVLHFVPSMLNVFLEYLESKDKIEIEKLNSLKQVFTSGETLTTSHVKRFNKLVREKTGTRLTNLYGPTEATIDVSFYDCPDHNDINKVPIGKPIDNIKIFITEKNKLLPVGETGELCIAGIGLARGYLNNPQLTNEKFVDCPFLPGEKMYKTGDLGRWFQDGNIEFLGREDFQVKIRGLRIELGEIESTIRNFQDINDCIVIVKKYSETIILIVAYLVSSKEINTSELKTYLKKYLPDYMIPNKFIDIEKIPLTPSGKADRKALPEPDLITKS
jgi:amino acid adenylation domain-containing protein